MIHGSWLVCCRRSVGVEHFALAKKAILENYPDFLNAEIEIVKRDHECIFYPKFHCELNSQIIVTAILSPPIVQNHRTA
jgi:hypothetical protein